MTGGDGGLPGRGHQDGGYRGDKLVIVTKGLHLEELANHQGPWVRVHVCKCVCLCVCACSTKKLICQLSPLLVSSTFSALLGRPSQEGVWLSGRFSTHCRNCSRLCEGGVRTQDQLNITHPHTHGRAHTHTHTVPHQHPATHTFPPIHTQISSTFTQATPTRNRISVLRLTVFCFTLDSPPPKSQHSWSTTPLTTHSPIQTLTTHNTHCTYAPYPIRHLDVLPLRPIYVRHQGEI